MKILWSAGIRFGWLAWAVACASQIGMAAPLPQATALKARHAGGQTFITWQEVDSPLARDQVSFPAYRQTLASLDKAEKVRYRIYRSLQPITNVAVLKPIAEVKPLTCWSGHFNGGGDPKESDLVPRFVVEEGQPPLPPGTGLYVHNPRIGAAKNRTTNAFYAVTYTLNGTENPQLTTANYLAEPVAEQEGQGAPVLQRTVTPKEYNYVKNPTLHYFVRWEAPPNYNVENQALDYVVGLPPQAPTPMPVTLLLHCWGGNLNSGYGWWFNAEKGHIMIAGNQVPYDWWTGFHELYGRGPAAKEAWVRGVVHPYTQIRLLSFLDWATTRWKIDTNRVAVGGSSMGGSGAPMFAIRQPERIAWAIGWVGVHVPEKSPTFKGSYAQVYGPPEWGVKFEDGTPVWDYFNDAWYLRQRPEKEIGFITWSNGKNDGGIGWPQAVEFYQAMQDTKRPHLFVWGQSGHGQRAMMPGGAGEERINPLDIRTDQSLPAFTQCSLDSRPGNGQPDDGDKSGSVNYYLLWDTKDIVDETNRWEMTIYLANRAPQNECTVSLTPRRLQKLRHEPGATFKWENVAVNENRPIQSGVVTADQHGLITLEKLTVTKGKDRVRVWKAR